MDFRTVERNLGVPFSAHRSTTVPKGRGTRFHCIPESLHEGSRRLGEAMPDYTLIRLPHFWELFAIWWDEWLLSPTFFLKALVLMSAPGLLCRRTAAHSDSAG
jgi:hypothetical protein